MSYHRCLQGTNFTLQHLSRQSPFTPNIAQKEFLFNKPLVASVYVRYYREPAYYWVKFAVFVRKEDVNFNSLSRVLKTDQISPKIKSYNTNIKSLMCSKISSGCTKRSEHYS